MVLTPRVLRFMVPSTLASRSAVATTPKSMPVAPRSRSALQVGDVRHGGASHAIGGDLDGGLVLIDGEDIVAQLGQRLAELPPEASQSEYDDLHAAPSRPCCGSYAAAVHGDTGRAVRERRWGTFGRSGGARLRDSLAADEDAGGPIV